MSYARIPLLGVANRAICGNINYKYKLFYICNTIHYNNKYIIYYRDVKIPVKHKLALSSRMR